MYRALTIIQQIYYLLSRELGIGLKSCHNLENAFALYCIEGASYSLVKITLGTPFAFIPSI